MQPLSSIQELQFLCEAGVVEGLNLEFKTKEDPNSPELSRSDKRSIAQAVSSFANSDGGTLVLGIRTARRDGGDAAVDLDPISEVERFSQNVRLVCGLNVSPEIPSLGVRTIYRGDDRSSGFVVCDVPRSDRRPHMSTAPGVHTYYRRTYDGSAPMTPSEIQDQILAVREAVIEPLVGVAAGAAFSNFPEWLGARTSFSFELHNVGLRTCKNPFMRISSSQRVRAHNVVFDQRLNEWKAETPPGTLIHTGDTRQFISFEFVAVIFPDKMPRRDGTEDEILRAIKIYETTLTSKISNVLEQDEISQFEFKVTYGAENSPSKTKTIIFDRDVIAANLIVKLEEHVRQALSDRVGVWRSDLIAGMAERLR